VRNHVKLSSCNHRLKESDTAVDTAESTSVEKVAMAGRAAMERMYNTREARNDTFTNFHAEATTEDGLQGAVLSTDDAPDWRKNSDGHTMAKNLKHIERQEAFQRTTGMRSAKQQEDWRKQLEEAMAQGDDTGHKVRHYKVNTYDATPVHFTYDDFTTKASWNFGRKGRPIFRDYGTTSTSPVDTQPFIIDHQPLSPATLDGTAYTRASPTFFKARMENVRWKPTIGLLDNCAAISLIDSKLIQQLDTEPTMFDREVKIKGVGSSTSNKFCIIPIYIDVTEKDSNGIKIKKRARIPVEFHVIDNLNESFVVGMDIIGPYQIDILTSDAQAKIQTAGGITFPLFFGAGMPRTMIQESYNVVAAQTVTVPPRMEMTINALIAAHGPGGIAEKYDLFLDHIPIVQDGLDTLGVVGKGLYASDASKVWFANLGSHPITISKGTRIANASHVSSMDTVTVLPIKHTAGGDGSAEMFSCVPKKVTTGTTNRKMQQLYNEPHSTTYVKEYAFPATLMEPTDRPPPPPGETGTDGTFNVSNDFGTDGRSRILRTLTDHIEAFTLDGKPGRINNLELKLDTEDELLHPERLRQTSPRKQIIMDEILNQLLEWEVISPSNSRLSYPVVIVHQNGKDRFCVDYRSLNKYTKPLIYPMQRSDEMFEALAGKQVFSSLDAARGYHQIPIDKEHRWKIAFITHRGLFEYNTMPFGLKTAPAVFQWFMDGILGKLRWTAALCYIDDVVIFSDTVNDHVKHLTHVMSAAIAAGLKFYPTKCHFGYASLKLLGRRISTEGLEVLQDKLAAVRQLKPPRNLRELWHVLGLFGYYRSFIHRYSIIAAPLTELMKGIKPEKRPDGTYTHRMGDTIIDWGEACQQAFETLKEKLTNPPLLAYPNFMNPFILYVDASHSGMACALHQLSAPPRPGEEDTAAHPMVPETAEELAALQRKDPTWQKVMDNIELFTQFTMKQGVLFHEEARCLPQDKLFMSKVLHDVHDANGHMGISKSYDVMRKQWYRPGMLSILTAYVNSCVICKGAKKSRQRPSGEMHPQRNLSALAFDNIAIDIFSLPLSDGYDACLTIMDTFTKTVVLQPTRTTASTEEVADMLCTSVICKGFLPSTIISDRDPKYTSDL
jgi:hypothetical protein